MHESLLGLEVGMIVSNFNICGLTLRLGARVNRSVRYKMASAIDGGCFM